MARDLLPAKLPQRRELEYASQAFGALEINATFYGRQSPKSWETWASDGARRLPVRDQGLALLRHPPPAVRRRGRASPTSSPRAWPRSARSSARSCGFAPRRQFDRDDIAGFLDLLPHDARRHAAAPRDRTAPRELSRRSLLRPLPRAQRRDRVRRRRRIPVHRRRHRRLRLRAAAADARGGADRL